jgi:hypothetical protein
VRAATAGAAVTVRVAHAGSLPSPTRGAPTSWVVTRHFPEEQDFSGKSLEEALAWCLVWLMVPELGIGPFLV